MTPTVRDRALDVIARAVPAGDVRLLAVAIMPNHLHIVVQQGKWRVQRFMQPILRRLAHVIQREHELEGPIFWGPYACSTCHDPDHARNAIVYTHLNPVRAGICQDPARYAWSSHRLYSADTGDAHTLGAVLDPMVALPLFATRVDQTACGLRDDYRRYVEWRLALDRASDGEAEPGGGGSDLPACPVPLAWGDPRWRHSVSPLFLSPSRRDDGPGDRLPVHTVDLVGLARANIAMEEPRLTLEDIQGRGGGRRYVELRQLIIRRAAAVGFPNVEIARLLQVSESAVSKWLRTPAD